MLSFSQGVTSEPVAFFSLYGHLAAVVPVEMTECPSTALEPPFWIVILYNSRWTQGLGVVPTVVDTACEDPMGLLGALHPRTDDPSRSLTPDRLTDGGHASWFLTLKGASSQD